MSKLYNDYLDNFSKYGKVTKKQAEKILNLGGKIIIVPCKCSYNSIFAVTITKKDIEDNYQSLNYGYFNNFVNHFTYYNCNKETGVKPAYYIV